MIFRYYTNTVSRASRAMAAGIFVTGLMLIGFGLLVYVLREIFAIIFAIIFCIAGIGCAVTALKILLFQRRFDKLNEDEPHEYRENVQIRNGGF